MAGWVESYWIEVGLDDDVYNNLTEFQAATTALGNEDIFDNPEDVDLEAVDGSDDAEAAAEEAPAEEAAAEDEAAADDAEEAKS